MTSKELLAATGNVWKVKCFRDGNRRRFQQTCYVRAGDIIKAEQAARRQSCCPVADARPWDPRQESVFGRFIKEVQDAA